MVIEVAGTEVMVMAVAVVVDEVEVITALIFSAPIFT